MPIDPQEFAKMLGAEIVGEVPDVGGGPFGMARLAQIVHKRLTPICGEQPDRPADPNWVTRCKVSLSDATLQSLTELAEEMSTTEHKFSPMQIAAHLLEDAVVLLELSKALRGGLATRQLGDLIAIGFLGLRSVHGDVRLYELLDDEYESSAPLEQLLERACDNHFKPFIESWRRQRAAAGQLLVSQPASIGRSNVSAPNQPLQQTPPP